MIGGACGALIAGWTGIGATAYGVTGLFGYLITTDDTLQYTLVIGVAFVVSFVTSWMLYHDEKTPGGKPPHESSKTYIRKRMEKHEIHSLKL